MALRSPDTCDILSICTGGGGLDLGVELAIPSARSVVLVEREAFAVAQLVSAMEQGLLHPAPVWSDARTFDGQRWRRCVDGLIGGIPCQAHSLAGKKRGSLDERDLWSPARRIIVQARPWFVLIENVGGMLSPGDDDIAGAERVWRDLRKLGFAVEAGLFTAAEVGASHERERIFILGVADSRDAGLQGCQRAGAPAERDGQAPPRSVAELRGASLDDAVRGRHGHALEEIRTGRHSAVDAGECAGVDLVDAESHRRREGRPESEFQKWHGLAAAVTGASMVDAIGGRHDWRAYDQIGRQVERTVAERSIDSPLFPPGPNDLQRWRSVLASSPELEPAFRRVADGLASRLDVARVDRLRMLGNGVVPLQAAYAVRTLATRLAERGSAGAARLVRMMEI
ncbi:DNA cytosine methyltransferase [Mesorhizobium sp. M0644]|uniref:DNA cytosine methyltransferase n=1 Tax=Mesorhizobium sp. M0644 TaxID=2956979 RepID=UPI003337740D